MKKQSLTMQNPILRGLFILEFVAAFAFPCIFLIPGSILAVISLGFLLSGELHTSPLLILMVVGGYLGMLGVLRLATNVLHANATCIDNKSLIFTVIGCLSILPFTWLMGKSGDLLGVIMGTAPILVAIQLFFMNRKDILRLFHRRDT